MDHPYKSLEDKAFWTRAFFPNWGSSVVGDSGFLIRQGDAVASAGSCFAANIIPHLEKSGFDYIRRDAIPPAMRSVACDNFNYRRFSAAYGNIYTIRQAAQILQRALGRFSPEEDRWIVADDLIIDPFRPGLKYPAQSNREFDLLLQKHLDEVLEVFRSASVFIFTLGLTESWVSVWDGAVFPACPGTIAGNFDPSLHIFKNFSVAEVTSDLHEFINLARELNPKMRFVITVSPVPLVATATGNHVLLASTYSKSVLRVAAQVVAENVPNVVYFPAYEIVTGSQAPFEFFSDNRRDPSDHAIQAVMGAFLSKCEGVIKADHAVVESGPQRRSVVPEPLAEKAQIHDKDFARQFSKILTEAKCEEEAMGVSSDDRL